MSNPLTDAELALLGKGTLLERGIAAARAGDNDEAHFYLQAATERDPLNPNAWNELAGVVDSLEEKRLYFERALGADPANEQARLGLERVKQKMGIAVAPRVQVEAETMVCYRHPDRETLVRCYRCSKPICTQCSVRGPVGLVCVECARANRPAIFDVKTTDYLIAGLVGLALSVGAGILLGLFSGIFGGFFGFFILFFVAPAAGGFIADLMSRSVRMKRGRGMAILAGACIVAGLLILSLVGFGPRLASLALSPTVWIYVVLAISGAYYRLR